MRVAEASKKKHDYYDSWTTREEAIHLILNRDNQGTLKDFFIAKLKDEEDIEGDSFRLQIHIDFNMEVLRFCFTSHFTAEQTSATLSTINHIFRESLKQKLTTDSSYENLETAISQYLHNSPPFTKRLFSAIDKNKMLVFSSHLYKFFQMYEISMTKFVDFNIITQELFVPFPVDEAILSGKELGRKTTDPRRKPAQE